MSVHYQGKLHPPTTCNHVVVFGASGDLARKKIYPALFSLYHDRMLPMNTKVVGYARTNLTDSMFHERIAGPLKCRLSNPKQSCDVEMHYFLDDCSYVQGGYSKEGDYEKLHSSLKFSEMGYQVANRLFYLSLPPSMYPDVTRHLPLLKSDSGWNRVIIEKPFGKDLSSFYELSSHINRYVDESSLYRIDHYLGKEVVENISVLRFANPILQPLWSKEFIDSIEIRFHEDIDIGDRAYFDEFGIVRDVIQNHVLQILALVAMEPPSEFSAIEYQREKVNLLKCVTLADSMNVVYGQYDTYSQHTHVKVGSTTETYAAICLYIQNERWQGVPFFVHAGKGLQEKCVEISVRFRKHLQQTPFIQTAPNELVIRIQPNESIKLKINNKVPGFQKEVDKQAMEMVYETSYENRYIPDAYEKLLLDVFQGEKRMFISYHELEESWRILEPLLSCEKEVIRYPFGSMGPKLTM